MPIKIKGELKWVYRAVDKDGDTLDFLLSAKRDENAALRFLRKAIRQHRVPKKSILINLEPMQLASMTSMKAMRLIMS